MVSGCSLELYKQYLQLIAQNGLRAAYSKDRCKSANKLKLELSVYMVRVKIETEDLFEIVVTASHLENACLFAVSWRDEAATGRSVSSGS